MATATKKKEAVKEEKKEEEVDELEVFESVAASIPRTLTHPNGEEKTFTQHELAFIPKTRFFRLVSSTLRTAADEGDGVNSLIGDIFSEAGAEGLENEQLVLGVMRLVELSPNFLEEAFMYALNVKPQDREWVYQSLDSIDDEMGLDIVDVFISQNAKSIKTFLPKLQKIGKKVGNLIQEGTEQE